MIKEYHKTALIEDEQLDRSDEMMNKYCITDEGFDEELIDYGFNRKTKEL